MKKYFICSDIHSDYTALENALKEHNFDMQNDNHILVVAGDVFDRGAESVRLYEFLKPLTDSGKAIVLKGNHHSMLTQFLKKENYNLCFFNHKHNGINTTIDDFTHQTRAWIMFIEYRHSDEEQKKMTGEDFYNEWVKFVNKSADEIKEEYPDLLSWLESMPDYLELKNSIITHGMIDGKANDWHYPRMGWDDCHWAKPKDAAYLYNPTGKHIYLGHIDSDTIRRTLHLPTDNYSLFTRNRGDVTYLDSCTILTHRLNMVVIEDEPLDDEEEICK